MPRGNPAVWKQHGASYAELAGTKTSGERAMELAPRRLPPVAPGDMATLRSMRPAGAPTGTLPRGAGTFALQSTWSLSAPAGTVGGPAGTARHSGGSGSGTAGAGLGAGARAGSGSGIAGTASSATGGAAGAAGAVGSASGRCGGKGRGGAALYPATSGHVAAVGAEGGAVPPRSYATETRVHYGPPPPGYRRTRSAGPVLSEMPRPDYPNDWCTSKQADFRPDVLARSQRPQPATHPDSGRLLPLDVPPAAQPAAGAATTQRAAHCGRSLREAQSIPASGARGTRAAGYNIITGAPALGNNAFEAWDGRDYRRHR